MSHKRFSFASLTLFHLIVLLTVGCDNQFNPMPTTTQVAIIADGSDPSHTPTLIAPSAKPTAAPLVAITVSAETTTQPACIDVEDIPASECRALLALYEATEGGEWTRAASGTQTKWFSTTRACEWSSIVCGDGHVTALHLQERNLRGELPVELALLSNLTDLQIYKNNLGGSLAAGSYTIAKVSFGRSQ